MTYGHLQADCLYTGISCGPNARYRVWESLYLLLSLNSESINCKTVPSQTDNHGSHNTNSTSSAVAEMDDRLATIDMRRKVGAAVLWAFGGGKLGPHLTQCGLGRSLPPCQVSSSSIHPFGHNTPTLQTDRTTVL